MNAKKTVNLNKTQIEEALNDFCTNNCRFGGCTPCSNADEGMIECNGMCTSICIEEMRQYYMAVLAGIAQDRPFMWEAIVHSKNFKVPTAVDDTLWLLKEETK